MIARVSPRSLGGTVGAIASKSVAHRLIIASALADAPTHVVCNTTCDDIEATARCLEALGARVEAIHDGFLVTPINRDALATTPVLDCGESGSTFRFMLPVACALGSEATFTGATRLAERPITPLTDELYVAGCDFEGIGTFPLRTHGTLRPGVFELPGNVSSQYISGIMLAAPFMGRTTVIRVHGRIESKPYVNITVDALKAFGVKVSEQTTTDGTERMTVYTIDGSGYKSPHTVTVEGDWSNAAFWLCAGAMGRSPITVTGLSLSSSQGDRNILGALSRFGARIKRTTSSATVQPDKLVGFTMSAHDIPDLVPIIAAVASVAEGRSVIEDCARLRLKESDRLETVTSTLVQLGAHVAIKGDDLVIDGQPELAGGTVDACNDHRIAMMASIVAMRCADDVVITGAQAVRKSYPLFFNDLRTLGGSVYLEEV